MDIICAACGLGREGMADGQGKGPCGCTGKWGRIMEDKEVGAKAVGEKGGGARVEFIKANKLAMFISATSFSNWRSDHRSQQYFQ